MGPAKVQVSEPADYMKKSDRSLPEPQKTEKKSVRKPKVPTRYEQNAVAAKTEKDFIKTNAIENITSVPRKPTAQYCDTNTGNKNDLHNVLEKHEKYKLTQGHVLFFKSGEAEDLILLEICF